VDQGISNHWIDHRYVQVRVQAARPLTAFSFDIRDARDTGTPF
jgi:hypothetical protein